MSDYLTVNSTNILCVQIIQHCYQVVNVYTSSLSSLIYTNTNNGISYQNINKYNIKKINNLLNSFFGKDYVIITIMQYAQNKKKLIIIQ